MNFVKVNGKDCGNVVLYALSTCIWCKKTKEFLDSINVSYKFVYVDQLTGKDREDAVNQLSKFNPSTSFPTIVINDKDCIVGFNSDKIKETLGL